MDSKPNIADFTGSDFDVVPFKPVWQPYNQTAITLLDTVIKSLPHVPTNSSRFVSCPSSNSLLERKWSFDHTQA